MKRADRGRDGLDKTSTPDGVVMTKVALITGITGQDGSYLAELLLSKGYEVHGIIRRASTFNTQRIDHIYQDPHVIDKKLFLHYGDITDFGTLTTLIRQVEPDEIYNLAAQSHVKVSFGLPEYTGSVTGLGVTCILEAARRLENPPRIYQASSSEMFGSTPPPQSEKTPFHPRSPYAVAKVYGYWMTVNYREAYDLFATNGILFNHESPRRGETFLTRKVTRAVANIKAGKQKKLYLGNLKAKRDWGFAPEYVEVMWRVLQQEEADDYVIGTGKSITIEEFVKEAFNYAGMEWEDYVEIDPRYLRPTEVDALQADPSKAKKKLGWEPMVLVDELAKIMVDYDMIRVGLEPTGEGVAIMEEKGFGWTKNVLTDG